MKYALTFGYYGSESADFNSTCTIKDSEEPVLSLEKAIEFFGLEKKYAKINVDMNLVTQGGTTNICRVKQIWHELIAKRYVWQDLKIRLIELLDLGSGLLPIFFDMIYENAEIEVIDGEHTISISTNDFGRLKSFKSKIEDEIGERVTPFGQAGSQKVTVNQIGKTS